MDDRLDYFFETLRRDARVEIETIIGLAHAYVVDPSFGKPDNNPVQFLIWRYIGDNPENVRCVVGIHAAWSDADERDDGDRWVSDELLKKGLLTDPDLAIPHYHLLTYEEKLAMAKLNPTLALSSYSDDLTDADLFSILSLFTNDQLHQHLRYIRYETDTRIVRYIRRWQMNNTPRLTEDPTFAREILNIWKEIKDETNLPS